MRSCLQAASLTLLVVFIIAIAGCGQKGALYLPAPAQADTVPAIAEPATENTDSEAVVDDEQQPESQTGETGRTGNTRKKDDT